MSSEIYDFNFNAEWKRRIEGSPEVKETRTTIEFHRRKIRQMHEELSQAELFEKELVRRLKSLEEKIKPPLMRFYEMLEEGEGGVDDKLVETSVLEEDHNHVLAILRKKAIFMEKMNRTQLLGFLKTVLCVRDHFLEKDNQAGVEILMEMASGVLRHLGRPTIDWSHLVSWEATFLRTIIREVEDMPEFAARIIDQFLATFVTRSDSSSHTQSTIIQTSNSSSMTAS